MQLGFDLDLLEVPDDEKLNKFILSILNNASKAILISLINDQNVFQDNRNLAIKSIKDNDLKRLLFYYSESTLISYLIDWVIGYSPKKSIFLFEIDDKFNFQRFVTNMEKRLGNFDYKKDYPILMNKKALLINDVVLEWIYFNRTFKQVYFSFGLKGEKIKLINDKGEISWRNKYLTAIIVLRDNSNIVEIRINSGIKHAKKALNYALNIVFSELENKYVNKNFLNFNSLLFIKRALEFSTKVGYLTLEFTGPSDGKEKDIGYGKISFSGRRTGNTLKDLRSDQEVKKKIEDAFRVGGITKMHGLIKTKLTGKKNLAIDPEISFGINFRENKIYIFTGVTEAGYNFLVEKIYEIYKGVEVHEKGSIITLDKFAFEGT